MSGATAENISPIQFDPANKGPVVFSARVEIKIKPIFIARAHGLPEDTSDFLIEHFTKATDYKTGEQINDFDDVQAGQDVVEHYDNIQLRYHAANSDKGENKKLTITGFEKADPIADNLERPQYMMALQERARAALIGAEKMRLMGKTNVGFGRTTNPVNQYMLYLACRARGLECPKPDMSKFPAHLNMGDQTAADIAFKQIFQGSKLEPVIANIGGDAMEVEAVEPTPAIPPAPVVNSTSVPVDPVAMGADVTLPRAMISPSLLRDKATGERRLAGYEICLTRDFPEMTEEKTVYPRTDTEGLEKYPPLLKAFFKAIAWAGEIEMIPAPNAKNIQTILVKPSDDIVWNKDPQPDVIAQRAEELQSKIDDILAEKNQMVEELCITASSNLRSRHPQ